MRIPSLSLAAALALAATQPAALAASTLPVQYQPAQDNIPSSCREFTEAVTIGGQPQQAVGQACLQPDGSWQITQTAPGQPPVVHTLPPEAAGYAPPYPYPYYPYYWDDPWYFGAPFFVGGSFFFGDRFHRFHDHDRFRHFDGFHRDFHRGFARFDGRFHGGGFHGGGFHGGGFHGGGFHGGGFHGGGFHGGGHGGGHH